ncbi:hypothetical protein [Sporosarcina sp. FSL W7-1283]|uniref:hypothetical protein n=1 Tax=Sporosarcina sp. FSL W7-1283 TaxID=2921560 RepID=UPI0030F7C181
MSQPIVSWYEEVNAKDKEVKGTISYGTVDADTDSGQKTFFIWNNRNSLENVSKMEEVTFTTRDRLGGTGDTPGNIVEAVRDNWFQVRVDSLNEDSFTPVGKGGVGTENESGVKAVGTNGATINPNAATASTWATGVAYEVGDYVKPTANNDYMYKVTTKGTTGGSEPSWSVTEGNVVTDGTVEYTTVKVSKKPATQEILGLANKVEDDGSNANEAGGNFVKVTVYAEVPVDASAGKNLLVQRVNLGTLLSAMIIV